MYEVAAEKGGEARHFEIREALDAVLEDLLQPGDTVLVKASHSMAFENIVQNILENEKLFVEVFIVSLRNSLHVC